MTVQAGQTALASDIINSTALYAADAGSSDTYAISLATAPASYVTGAVFRFKANTANTGAATLNVNSLGAKTIKKNYNQDLTTGDIVANQIIEVIYDGTNFQLLSHPSNAFTLFAKGTATKDTSGTSPDTTIAHGLGVIPKVVRMRMVYSPSGGISDASVVYSDGAQSHITQYGDTGSGTGEVSLNTAFAFLIDSTPHGAAGAISVDATNITITWSAYGGTSFSAGTAYILWEAQA